MPEDILARRVWAPSLTEPASEEPTKIGGVNQGLGGLRLLDSVNGYTSLSTYFASTLIFTSCDDRN